MRLTDAAAVPELVARLASTAEAADGVETMLVAWVGLLTLIYICQKSGILRVSISPADYIK